MTDPKEIKAEIIRLTREYSRLVHTSFRPASDPLRKNWNEGDGIPYAGRVFTEDEVEAAVSSTLDFWLTLGQEGTTFQKELKKHGIIFCSISEAVKDHEELVKEYLGSVIPYTDNYFATLNSAVFTDGTFVYIPKGVSCPMELNTYFRINARNTGQFERTLIIADEDSYVSYLEGCTAPAYDENTLHAACVELITKDNAEIKYSTVQNWYPGDEDGVGGVYNFVTKRAKCEGKNFGDSTNTYRGAVKINPGAKNASNYTKCDSLMLQDSRALTIPYVTSQNDSAMVEHEASAGKISEEQMYYLATRGFSEDDAMNLVVNGFCKDVFQKLPLEFAAEANQLLAVQLEGAVG